MFGRVPIQAISLFVFAIGFALAVYWMVKSPRSGRSNWYAFSIIVWLGHGTIFYLSLSIYRHFGIYIFDYLNYLLGPAYEFNFMDWSAVLRLHGAIAAVFTV